MWVKSCGTTSLDDARLAAEAGADAIGFVFATSSRRRVTAEMVAPISAALAVEFPAVERIGVFASTSQAEIVQEARTAGLTGVQLHGSHGGVTLASAVRLLAPELSVTGVVHWVMGDPQTGDRVRTETAQMFAAGVDRVLLDSKAGSAIGGTGVPFDWGDAAEAVADVRAGGRLIVAGGLRRESVGEAIRILQPWGVDVASGTEAEVGRKSRERLRDFIAATRC